MNEGGEELADEWILFKTETNNSLNWIDDCYWRKARYKAISCARILASCEGRTDGRIDKASFRLAISRLKKKVKIYALINVGPTQKKNHQ